MNAKEIVRAGYNLAARAYLASRAGDAEDVLLLDDLRDRLPDGASVLDVGCGAGVPVTAFLSRHFAVTGVDISEEQLRLAREHLPSVRFVCQDMTTLAFPDASFDAICSYYAIIHVPRDQHAALLASFHRMLRPGGCVLLCMGAGDTPTDIDEAFCGVSGARMYWSHFDAATNRRMLAESGFAIEWARLVRDGLSPGHHLFVLAWKPAPP